MASATNHLSYYFNTAETSVNLMNIKPETQNLLWGYQYKTYDPLTNELYMEHIGFEASFKLDLAAGYQIFMHWLIRDKENLLIFNPNIFFQLATWNHVAFKLYFIEWWFRFNVTAEKFSPVDYQALWSLDNMESYCHSVSWV